MHAITLATTETRYSCADDDTLLRAGLREGLGLAYECNVGSCGTCKVELIEGELHNRWPAAPGLNERDRARGRVLACQSQPLTACTIKARVLSEYRPLHRPRRFRATLVATVDLTHDMREFRFRTDDAPAFEPGQYALLSFADIAGPRAYSMCNLPADGAWHFVIKRLPGGAGTGALFDTVAAGDSIDVDGPYGRAYLRTDSPRDIVCIAGGSGLSPVIAIARAMAREPRLASTKLHFFYGGRAPRDICGDAMLAELPGWGDRIRFYPAISMPELDVDGRWRGETGFVHEVVARTLGANLVHHEIYFAGPPVMAQAVQRMLLQHRVPLGQIHFDAFY